MAKLYINEYERVTFAANGQVAAADLDSLTARQVIDIGGASVQSAAFQPGTKYIELHTDAIGFLDYGASPTATDEWRVAAGETRYYGASAGKKIAVIQGA